MYDPKHDFFIFVGRLFDWLYSVLHLDSMNFFFLSLAFALPWAELLSVLFRPLLIWLSRFFSYAESLADLILAALEISRLVLPSSRHPDRATHYFNLWNESLPKLQWRGWWASSRMMEHYAQEQSTSTSQSSSSCVPPPRRGSRPALTTRLKTHAW